MAATRAVTLTEVALRAGVSLTTASKAINGRDRISEETRSRVLEAARELSYTPNPMARSLISGRSGTVGVIIIESMAQRFAIPVMLGAEAALGQIDLSMIVADARGDQGRLHEMSRMLRQRKVDGLIVIGDNQGRTPSITAESDVPIVYVYGVTDDPRDIVHVPDDRDGGALITGHVIDIGRRRIAHLTGPRRVRAVIERVKGVHDRLARDQMTLVDAIQYGRWSQRWGRRAGAELLERHPDVDAVVCGSDQIAVGVVEAVIDSGRRIPDDVAITGYDNWDIFADESEPPLTSVDMNLEALGTAAVDDLFSVIDGLRVGGGVRTHECTLIIRDSTSTSADADAGTGAGTGTGTGTGTKTGGEAGASAGTDAGTSEETSSSRTP
jgi:LacI family transcriptional regulator